MKEHKKLWRTLFLTLTLAVCVVGISILLLHHFGEKQWILHKNADKAMALLLTDVSGLPGEYSYVPEGQRQQWYAPYMEYLFQKGALPAPEGEALEEAADKPVTWQELYQFAQSQGVSRETIRENVKEAGEEGEKVSEQAFCQWYEYMAGALPETGIEERDLILYGTPGTAAGLSDWEALCMEGRFGFSGLVLDPYVDREIRALCKGNEIILLKEVVSKEIVYENLWISQWDENHVTAFFDGISRTWYVDKKEAGYQGVLADLFLQEGRLIQADLKKESIRAQVTAVGEDFMDLEGYGQVPKSESFRVYKIYGTLEQRSEGEILSGTTYQFIVAKGKLCAVLLDNLGAEREIRVLLHNSDYQSIYHQEITISCDTEFKVTANGEEAVYQAGENAVFTPESDCLNGGSVLIEPVSYAGILSVPSVTRRQGVPEYQGTLEISKGDQGLLLINELPVEEYLCMVVPSEMPTSYGVEALKVQAICARSYAYQQMEGEGASQYGADVDDSSTYQVYNNTEPNEDAVLAVQETYGQVLGQDGSVVTAYYFATSAGHTTDITIWNDNPGAFPYIQGKGLGMTQEPDLTEEETFRTYIQDENYPSYDQWSGWYRWKITMPVDTLTEVVRENLPSYAGQYPTHVLYQKEDGSFEQGVVDIGTVTDIQVAKRDTGGIVSELLLFGTEGTVKLLKQGAVRSVLGSTRWKIEKKDDTLAEDKELLPSAYIAAEPVRENETLTGFVIYGGGYGHGVGMSQTAVKTMVDQGMNAQDVLTYFYNNVEIMELY